MAAVVVAGRREQMEMALRDQASLLDRARDAIIATNLDQRIAYWNASAERMYGWNANEVFGRRLDELNLGFDPQRFSAALAQTLDSGEWRGELRASVRGGLFLRRLRVRVDLPTRRGQWMAPVGLRAVAPRGVLRSGVCGHWVDRRPGWRAVRAGWDVGGADQPVTGRLSLGCLRGLAPIDYGSPARHFLRASDTAPWCNWQHASLWMRRV